MTPVSFDEIVASLQARTRDVAEAYAPGGHIDGGRYWALCPWRADSKIGSFQVGLTGAYAGRWKDFASGEHGDMLDLIQQSLMTDRRGALDEARRFLGIAEETAEQRAVRQRAAVRAAEARKREEAEREKAAERSRASAHRLWLECLRDLNDTPVAAYLAARGIGLAQLGRTPNAVRYAPSLPYRHVDPETGEIFEGEYPAMVTAIMGPHVAGEPAAFWGAHRTWLAQEPGGRWWKAPVPKPKKVLGSVKGGYVRLWAGFGPRGGHGAPLSRAPHGTSVFVAEGIETGLSAAVLRPDARVLAAVSLGNFREMVLPPQVSRVIVIRDHDVNPKNRDQVDRAKERWLGEGRAVGDWECPEGGSDLNDALMAALRAEGRAAE